MKEIDFIQTIKLIMKAKCFSQQELSELLEVSYTTLNRWLNSHNVMQPCHKKKVVDLLHEYNLKEVYIDDRMV